MPGKQVLINVVNEQQYRVAIVKESSINKPVIEELELISPYDGELKGNIYKGKITRIVKSLEAAFVDIGVERDAFLPFSEVSEAKQGQLAEDQNILVMVKKDTAENKGVEVTTHLEFQSDFFAMQTGRNISSDGIISSSIMSSNDKEKIEQFQQLMRSQSPPEGYALIMRTAAIDQEIDGLQDDIDHLLQIYNKCQELFLSDFDSAAKPLYSPKNTLSNIVRRYVPSADEIIVDDEEFFYELRMLVRRLVPWAERNLKQHDPAKNGELFVKRNIEREVSGLFSRRVEMPKGGSVVFDQTEALLAIDVNSGGSKKSGHSVEQMALTSNLKAVELICSQIKLRDVGGLVVVDFIDMDEEGRKAVEKAMDEALELKPADDDGKKRGPNVHTSGVIDPILGLYSLARKRSRKPVIERFSQVCIHCDGSGWSPKTEIQAQRVVNLIAQNAGRFYSNDSDEKHYMSVRVSNVVARIIAEQYAHRIENIEQCYGKPVAIKGETERAVGNISIVSEKQKEGADAIATSIEFQDETALDLQTIMLNKRQLSKISMASRPPEPGMATKIKRFFGGLVSSATASSQPARRQNSPKPEGRRPKQRKGGRDRRSDRPRQDGESRRSKPATASNASPRKKSTSAYKVDQIVKGVVKQVDDKRPCASIDLKDIEAELFISNIRWGCADRLLINQLITEGEELELKVLSVESDSKKLQLGIRQNFPNVWKEFIDRSNTGDKISGRIQAVHEERGIYVELAPGLGGLVGMADISWDTPAVDALKRYTKGQEVEMVIMLLKKTAKARGGLIRLSIKHAEANQIQDYLQEHPTGTEVEGRIIEVRRDSLSVQLGDHVDGIVIRKYLVGKDTSELSTGDPIKVWIKEISRNGFQVIATLDEASTIDAPEPQDAGPVEQESTEAVEPQDAEQPVEPESQGGEPPSRVQQEALTERTRPQNIPEHTIFVTADGDENSQRPEAQNSAAETAQKPEQQAETAASTPNTEAQQPAVEGECTPPGDPVRAANDPRNSNS